jgi:hypothetical protein
MLEIAVNSAGFAYISKGGLCDPMLSVCLCIDVIYMDNMLVAAVGKVLRILQ